MAKSLNDFVQQVRRSIDRFEEEWLSKHKEMPELYPLEIEDDNEGLWWEMFNDFDLEN